MTTRKAQLGALIVVAALGTFVSTTRAEDEVNSGNPESSYLPPVPTEEMTSKAPQPSWDTGLLLSACGVGKERPFERTKFCLGALGDVVFFRENEDEFGFGGYAQLGTAGFRDVRGGVGLSAVFSLVDWFTLTTRGGGLVVASEGGTQPGLEGYVELGQRSVSLKSHYALSHSLFGGLQYALETTGLPASSTIWIGLRLDAVWLTAPVALFR